MTQTIERSGDMGQGSKLTLLKDNEGDIHVSVMPIGHKASMTNVEFCNSGSKSQRTLNALHELYNAMEDDEKELADYNLTNQFDHKWVDIPK
jgi:hypothetical protein